MKDTNFELIKEIFDVGLYNRTCICYKACTFPTSVNKESINDTKTMLLHTVLTNINNKVIAAVKKSTEDSLASILNTELIAIKLLFKGAPPSYYQNLSKWMSGKEDLKQETMIHAFVVLRDLSAKINSKLKKMKIVQQKIITITLDNNS